MSLADPQWCPTSVQVTVLQARGLRIKGKGGTNDAYAVMQVGKEKYQTSVVEKSVAPVWKEEAAFDLPHQGGGGGGGGTERTTLHVHVLHRALVGPDKQLGQAVINLLQLSEDKTRDKTEWFKLLDKTGKADKDRGEVLLDIQFMRNNMTASMFDLSAAGKSRSRLGKFKDKVRGKKKESEPVSSLAPSFTQVLTDSEEEANGAGEAAAGKDGKVKKHKMKSLFSPKSNLQKSMSQSMSVLPAKNSTLSGSQSSGLNVDSSEGKKKFKFKLHKRSGSSDSKDSQKQAPVEQSNLCINGSHVYCEEPQPRTSRIGSNFSLASSGHGSMEDVPENSPPSVDSLRTTRQYSPWTEEEEEGGEEETAPEVKNMKENQEESGREEEERRRKEEEEETVRRQQEEVERLAEEKRRAEEERVKMEEEERRREEEERVRREEEEERGRLLEEEKRRKIEEEERQREEEERIRREEEKRRQEEKERVRMEEERAQEERRRREEERKLAEEKRRMEEEERRKIEEEKVRQEEEERRRREERAEEERRRKEEEELVRRQEQERREKEEEEERIEKETRRRQEEETANREKEEYERLMEEKRKLEEERIRKEEEEMTKREEERVRKEKEEKRRLEEEEMARKQALMRQEEEEKARQEKEEKERLLEEKIRQEEVKRMEEEERVRKEEEERIRMEEEVRQKEEERAREEKREMERLAEERRRLEEEERVRKKEEERVRKEEEERVRKEKEERVRKEEEERVRKEEEERVRKEEEERIRKEEEERVRKEEEERIRKEEEERVRKEEEERVRKEEEERIRVEEQKRQEEEERARKERERLAEERLRLEEQEKRRMEEEERIMREERAERERKEEERRLEKEKLTSDAENKTKDGQRASGKKSKMNSHAEVTSTNPFDENFSCNPFEEIKSSSTSKEATVQQRCQSAVSSEGSKTVSTDEKDLISSQREKRPAPQPPGRNQAEKLSQREQEASAQTGKQSKDKDVKTVSVPPQRSVQAIAPLSRSPQCLTQSDATKGTTNAAKHGKRPAPSRPLHAEEELSSTTKTAVFSGENKSNRGSDKKQVPVVYGLNPFEDDEDEQEEVLHWPPAVSTDDDKDAASQTKIKSSKMARAPLPPAKSDATSDTIMSQNTDVTDDARVNVCDAAANQASDPHPEPLSGVQVQESPLQESQPIKEQNIVDVAEKKEGPPTASRRLQPVRPLNPLEQQSVSVVQEESRNKSTGLPGGTQDKTKVNDGGMKGPYSQLTQGELISLVLKQENQLSERDKKISELEQYIDNLLVRVLEENPSILMSMSAMKKAA